MTDSATAYRAILKPSDVPLVGATDIRTLELTLSPTNTSTYEAAVDQIRETGCIDTYAFDNHWDLYYVHRCDTAVATQLRDALHAVPYAPQHWTGTHLSLKLRLQDDQTHHWHSTAIGVQEHTLKHYNRWTHSLARTSPAVAECDEKHLQEAMLRAVAIAKPSLVERMFTDPVVAHDSFVSIAINNEDTVLTNLSSTTP